MNEAATLSYTNSSESFCKGNNIHASHPELKAHQCNTKCGPGSLCEKDPSAAGCAACTGYLRAYDDGSDALCLAEADCQALCTELSECYGVEVAADQAHYARCYLNTYACIEPTLTGTLAEDPNWHFWYKVRDLTAACPLGHGIRLEASEDVDPARAELEGVYDRFETPEGEHAYYKVDGPARVVWHASGCGFAVEQLASQRRNAGLRYLRADAAECADDHAAAARALGAQSDDAVCGLALWAQSSSYCDHALFAALCPGSCEHQAAATCTTDADAAAPLLHEMLTGKASEAKCADLVEFCADAVVASACKATCAGTRADAGETPLHFVATFRASLQSHQDQGARRLGWDCASGDCKEARYYEVFYSFEPALTLGAAAGRRERRLAVDNCTDVAKEPPVEAVVLYDVLRLHEELDQEWKYTCGVSSTYNTFDSRYCPHNNLDVTHRGVYMKDGADMADEACTAKCDGPNKPKEGQDGASAHCGGMHDNFDENTNALCLPRSECEAWCTALGDACSSFDMDTTKTRCWLNNGYCEPGENPYTHDVEGGLAQLLSKGIYVESSELEFVYKWKGKDVYETFEQQQCQGGTTLSPDLGLELTQCNNVCGGADLVDTPIVVDEDASALCDADCQQRTTDLGSRAARPIFSVSSKYVAMVIDGKVSIGLADLENNEVHFGPANAIEVGPDDRHVWGNTQVVADPAMGDKNIIVIADMVTDELPYFAALLGTIDEQRLTVKFEEPVYIEGGYDLKGSAMRGRSVYVAFRDTMYDEIVVRQYNLDQDDYQEVSLDVTPFFASTETTSFDWDAFFYGSRARKLAERGQDDIEWYYAETTSTTSDLSPDFDAWNTSTAGAAWLAGVNAQSNASAQVKIVDTSTHLVFAVSSAQGPYLWTSRGDLSAGLDQPIHVGLDACAHMDVASVNRQTVIVTCAANTSVLCSLEDRTCGDVQGWTPHADEPTDGAGDLLGYSVTCPTASTCIARTRNDILYIITVDAKELKVDAAVATDNAKGDTENFAGHTVSLGRSHVFYSRHDYNGTTGETYGVLVHELVNTWSERSATACAAYDTLVAAGNPVPDSLFCGTRQQCEHACSKLGESCAAFSMTPGEYSCTLVSSCDTLQPPPPGQTTRTVKKTSSNVCQVTVSSADDDVADEVADACTYLPGSCDLCGPDVCSTEGVYAKVTLESAFAKADDSARIVFDAEPCNGWSLKVNRADPVEVTLTTLRDAPQDALGPYIDAAILAGAGPNTWAEKDCVHVASGAAGVPPGKTRAPGFECTNDVLEAMCPSVCQTLNSQYLSGETRTYHLEGALFDANKVGVIDTNNADAVAQYVMDTSPTHPDGAPATNTCADWAALCASDTGIKALCPTTCRNQVAFHSTKYKYLPWNDDETETIFRTYANGSDTAFAHRMDASKLVRDLGIPQCSLYGTIGDTAKIAESKFRAFTPQSPMTLKSVCAHESLCPTLTTCVENEFFFDHELTRLRQGLATSALYASDARVDGQAWPQHLSGEMWTDTAANTADPAFPYLFPKVLLSTQRAEALIRTSQWEFGKEIFRPVPLHTRLRLRQTGSAHTIAVTMVDSADHWSRQELGRTYAAPEGYDAWHSDVVRLEAFEAKAVTDTSIDFELAGGDADMQFELFVPGVDHGLFRVYRFAHTTTGDSVGVPLPAGAVRSHADDPNIEEGWFVVSVPMQDANADFVATADTDECAKHMPCVDWKDGGMCTNVDGGYVCGCRAGYFLRDDHCILGSVESDQYNDPMHEGSRAEHDQQFLLYHVDAASHGWHVQSVELFPAFDEEGNCAGDGHSYWLPDSLKTSGQYTDDYSPANLDNMMSGEWWSEKLALSRKDGTGGFIAFDVSLQTQVECVRLSMSCRQQMPQSFTLHRGTVGRVEQSSAFSTAGVGFTAPGTTNWLETVTKHRGESTSVDFAIPCGIQDSQYFGEVFYDYQWPAQGLAGSACECKQLCLDHVFHEHDHEGGCATWKYYAETKHCYLQRDIFAGTDAKSEPGNLEAKRASKRSWCEDGKGCAQGAGWWKRPFASGWHGWVTGQVGPLATELALGPAQPVLGEEFTVTLHGVGFPFDEEIKDDLGARQRIKILPEGESCVYDTPPDYVEGLDCTNEYACSPRPDSYTRTSATWSGLKISASKADQRYQVCWCPGQCWSAASWQQAPGAITVAASKYSWAFAEKLDGPFTRLSTVGLRVSRPAFSSTAPNADWRVKFVQDIFDCEHLADAAMCGGADDCGAGTTDTGPDEALFAPVMTAAVKAKDYHVCFSEDAGATWLAIPSAASRFLTVGGLDSDASHPRGAFHHQRFSARSGKTARVVVEGYRMFTPPQASISIVEGKQCVAGATRVATLGVDAAASSASAYVFTGEIGDLAQSYAVCLCDGDLTLAAAAAGNATNGTRLLTAAATTYVTAAYGADGDAEGLLAGTETDACAAKCGGGCLGPHCYCGGLTADAGANALCLDAAGCRAACDASDDCEGYSFHRTLSRCYLHAALANATTEDNAEYDLWEKKEGATCQEDADFLADDAAGEVQKNIGTFYVTEKVDVGVDYIVTPKQATSIEVTGQNLDYMRDRIMVIDCYGTCGVSEPSKDAFASSDFHSFVAENAFIDRPALDSERDPEPYDYGAGISFVTRENEYCPGANMYIRPDSLADHHSCYQKCYVHGPCTDESCFCDGYFPGHDTETTGALCLEEQQCKDLCAQTAGCTSVDMHRNTTRCFLNMQPDCEAAPSPDYNLLIAQDDLNTGPGRRLKEMGRKLTPAQVRHLLAAEDPGISWDQILRFKGLEFASGGEYKLCFCDSALLGEGEICNDKTDYTVEVGKIHASGLQCLLSNDKMTRGTCEKQEYDGLRCYDEGEEVPDIQVPIDFLGVPSATRARAEIVDMVVAFCQYADEGYTYQFDFCDQYRGSLDPAAMAGTSHGSP